MAYKTTVNKSCSNQAMMLTELWSQLAAMGWTLVDGSFTAKTIAYTGVSVADDTFTSAGHGLVNGTPCQLTTTGTAPGALAVLTLYYIVSVTTDTFKLSATYNGSGINISSQGTGNHTITEAFRVYSSTGETANRIVEYMKFAFYASITAITIIPSYAYNTTTHVQTAAIVSYFGGLTTSQSGFYLWIHGNKDVVVITIKISTVYNRCLFGHMKSPYPLLTTLTAGATSGAGATLSVASTEGFEVGSIYQILGISAEGRDSLTVASIVDTTSMTVTNLPRNYASGSFIGDCPSTFGTSRGGNDHHFYVTCPALVAGLSDTTQYNFGVYAPHFLLTILDPDDRINKYVLHAINYTSMMNNVNSTASVGLYYDTYAYQSPVTGMTNEDTFTVGKLDSGTSSGSNNTTEFNDTSKAWTTNFYANKCLIITVGTGAGQIKKIASNTATKLTLASGWTLDATDNTTQYVICSEAYRYVATAATELALREGV